MTKINSSFSRNFKVLILFGFLIASSFLVFVNNAHAQKYEILPEPVVETASCGGGCGCSTCGSVIRGNHASIQLYNQQMFFEHHKWMIDTFFRKHIAYAMALMTAEMTAVGMQQVKIIGTFFDAKHQLETQRLFQTLMAEAHKDYHPSEGMCDIGTTSRGLFASEQKSILSHQTLANRVMERQLVTGDNLTENTLSDLHSRIDLFKKTFCKKTDNANGLRNLCKGAGGPRETLNKDVDYTRTIDSNLTLDVDFSKDSAIDSPNLTPEEKSVFALMANLFAHENLPIIGRRVLANEEGEPKPPAYNYMSLRAIAAKRSVAQNSLSAIIGERTTGEKKSSGVFIDYAKFVKSTIKELGVPEAEIEFIIGKNPSYFAQMEVLTKKLYQNPVFYTELYDKPANILRKRAAIRAINLMQDRDYYKSLLRSEAVLSVVLESMLKDEHKRVYEDLRTSEIGGKPINE